MDDSSALTMEWFNCLQLEKFDFVGKTHRFAMGFGLDEALDILRRFDRTWPMSRSPLCGSRCFGALCLMNCVVNFLLLFLLFSFTVI